MDGNDGYDKTNLESILEYASRLTGRTMREFLGDPEDDVIGGVSSKGTFGQLVEEGYFHIENNSRPEPDFSEVGLELKVVPVKKVRGGFVSKERTVLNIINYGEALVDGFGTFTHKSSHVMFVFYLWEPDVSIYDYRVLKVVEWVPEGEELRLIHDDWDIIEGYIARGEAHLLSERHTKYLSACTKGVGHGKDMVQQPMSDIPAKRRALSLKQSFMTTMFEEYPDIGSRKTIESGYGSLFQGDWPVGMGFERYVLDHFQRFVGMDCATIESKIGYSPNDANKAYYSNLVMAMLGSPGKKHIRELVQADVYVKTIRLMSNGKPKESMSFPSFKYEEVAVQEWDESDFHDQVERRFLFPVFAFDGGVDVGRRSLRFLGAFFWSPSDQDLETMESVWYDTRNNILEGCMDGFTRISDRKLVHVRPHGRNSHDTYPWRGRQYVKRCFWFNDAYVRSIVEGNLYGPDSTRR